MKSIASVWNDSMQNVFNSDLIGFDSDLYDGTGPNLKNVAYQLTEDYTEDYIKISGLGLYDFTGSVVDTAFWQITTAGTGSTVTQTGGAVIARAGGIAEGAGTNITSSVTSTGSTGIELSGGAYFVNISQSISQQSDPVFDGIVRLNITDMSSEVPVYALTGSGGPASAELHNRLNIDKAGETCAFTSNLSSTSSTGINLSALDNAENWYLRIWTYGRNDTDAADRVTSISRLRQFKKIDETDSSEYIISLGTSSENITDIIPLFNEKSFGSSSASYSVSVDGGSNYTASNNLEIVRPTDTGSDIYLKAELSSDTGGNVAIVYETAAKYNIA